MRWFHLPIRGVSAPSAEFEAAWEDFGPELHRLLNSGAGVFVHCKGGLGRAGTVAARLLMELGEQPDDAIGRVRAAPPGAIEVREQEDYLRALARHCEPKGLA